VRPARAYLAALRRAARGAGVLLLAGMLGGAAALAGPSTPEELARAREAVQRRAFAMALPLYERLLQLEPANADLLIEAARVFGWADRNADAARLYRLALAAAPARRGDILPSLAWQTLWSGEAAAARVLFEEWLRTAGGPGRAEALDGLAQAHQAGGDGAAALAAWREAAALRPDDARLQRRIGLALLWSDRHDEAIAHLAAATARAPADRDTAWALANALNFAGRHQQALAVFNRWAPPVQPGERADLARAWRWAGYEDRALPLLEGASDAESSWLRRYRVERELRPYGYLTFEQADDRDDLQTQAWVIGAGWRPRPGTNVEFNARRVSLADPNGSPDATQFEASWRSRHGEPGAARGTWWPSLALKVHRFGNWHPVTPTARLKWVPDDRWRFDAEFTRELVEAPLAIANRVHVDVLSAGVTRWLDARRHVGGSLAWLRFDDGTARTRVAARGEQALWMKPRWVLGAELMHFERTREGPAAGRGYWNPQRYGEARVYTQLSHEWRPWDLQARIGLGRSREVDGSGQASSGSPHLWELGIGLDAAPAWRLRLALGGSGRGMGLGAAGSGAGYWRRWANLSVNGWF
jgi:tetratricopeptide (TPR) repeat protein